jgi:3-deoxy-D-manno-octulosonic-acid transferase
VSTPFALSAYRLANQALSPLAGAWLHLRARNGKEDRARLAERFGRAGAARPAGTLIWLHGASVGETRVLLSVRDGLAQRRADANFLITTGTRTSAAIVAADCHPRTRHQFSVLDAAAPVRRFLDHWRPDLGVFAESEIWPNLVLEAGRRGVPLALVNACMGEKSLANWARAPETAAAIFSAFDLILAADQPTAAGLAKLSGRPVPAPGNLKLAAAPAPPDEAALKAWRERLGARPVWIAASTHEGEDEIAIAAHGLLRRDFPDALLIIAPRHPARGRAVAALAGDAPRRSRDQTPAPNQPIFIVDTLGELGLFYALSPVVLIGGSLIPPLEGHNPVEPTLAGAAVIAGPHVSSFQEIFDALARAGGVRQAGDAESIAAAVAALWRDEAARAAQVQNAQRAVAAASPGLGRTIDALLALLADKKHVQHASA